MQIAPDLSLVFNRGATVARPLNQWRGFWAKHIVIGSEEFAFERRGVSHYPAFHDMIVDDGEIAFNGVATGHSRDWRRSVAVIPTGHATQGWVTPTSRRNSITALYFEPGLISDELERRYAIATPITVSDLTRICGLSRFQSTRAFKKATGVAPYAYVTAKRIERARDLLDAPGSKIEDIAARVGCPTSAQFRQAFRAKMGCSAQGYWRRRE